MLYNVKIPMRRWLHIFSPEKAFLFLGLIYGMIILVITPPFQVPDESNHFFRAYQVSEGHFIPEKKLPPLLTRDEEEKRDMEIADEMRILYAKGDPSLLEVFHVLRDNGGIGGLLPKSLVEIAQPFFRLLHRENRQSVRDTVILFHHPLKSKDRVFIHFPNTSLYSPVPYLPQAIGIALGRTFNLSPLALMYSGRITNLLVWIFLIYLAIKYVPVCKWVFFLLALMPMSLYQAASLSADSFTFGLSFLLVSFFLRYSVAQKNGTTMNVSDVFIIFALSLLLSLSKQAYFLMPLLFLLIPRETFGSSKKYYIIFLLIFLTNFGAIVCWTLTVDIYKDIYSFYRLLFMPNLSAEGQLSYLFSHSSEYCRTLITTYVQKGGFYVDTFVGQLGWLDTPLPELVRISYLGMLVVAALFEGREGISISLKQKVIIITTLILSVTLISTLAYIGWSPVGSNIILDIQGRYFIPLSPLFFLLFYNGKLHRFIAGIALQVAVVCYSLFSLTYMGFTIVSRYYV